MYRSSKFATLTLSLFALLSFQQPFAVDAQSVGSIRITGLVNRPINVTETALLAMPMVTEVATLTCVWYKPVATFNWTGVPLFHLLTLAEVKPEAYKVVFRARDGFSSSLNVSEALKPTTLLAVKANGTLLSEVASLEGVQGGFRIVAPCKWGYKWVTYVEEIEVVDYDYKGTYEELGFSDEADIANCTSSSLDQPLQTFQLTFGNRTFTLEAFTNVTIDAFRFDYQSRTINVNTTTVPGASGFIDFIIQQDMLKGPYSARVDETASELFEANVTNRAFLHLHLPEGSHSTALVGETFFGLVPTVIVEPLGHAIYTGKTVVFNASQSKDDGQIITFQWDFGDGSSGTGAVVSHSYPKEGKYQVKLNITDNDMLSSITTLSIAVQNEPLDIVFAIKATSALVGGALIAVFLFLLTKKRKRSQGVEHPPPAIESDSSQPSVL